MSNENDKGSDFLGVKSIGDSIKIITKSGVDGASAFLSRICLPAAEEFGLLLKDKVSAWRANNATKVINKSQKIKEQQVGNLVVSAHPKIIYSIIENGSWAEDDFIQNLWAGLLASSCTQDGKDESNLILINLLSQLTTNQAKIIKYNCETAKIYKSKHGLMQADELIVEPDLLIEITGISDLQQIDRELDHLRTLGLIQAGFYFNDTNADVTPQPLCLQLYVRSQGYIGSAIDYFGCTYKN